MTVDLGLTADQEAIAELFDGFFTKESPTTVARAAEPLGFDRDLWDKLLELGAPGMGSPEAVGGGGAALSDLVVVAEAARPGHRPGAARRPPRRPRRARRRRPRRR